MSSLSFAAPIVIEGLAVRPEWIDGNGHMNVGYYNVAFDQALDRVCELVDLSWNYVERTGFSTFVLETHVTYQREVTQGDPLRFTFQLLDYDEKKFHYFLRMFHAREDFLSATSEQICIHVDLRTRRPAPMPAYSLERFAAIMAAHRALPRPSEVGSVIGIRRKQKTA
jgi:acyl-CoA thioester hydrolase